MVTRLRSWFVTSLVVLMVSSSLGISSTRAAAQETLSAAFEWSMHDRLGLDTNNNGVIDVQGVVNPTGWLVQINACASTGPIARYSWSIDGLSMGGSVFCAIGHEFPSEGVFSVTLTVDDGAGHTNSVTHEVIVQDWLIVAIGDSIGSGEGNPDIPIPSNALTEWADAVARLEAAALEIGDADRVIGTLNTALSATNSLIDCLLPSLDFPFVPKCSNPFTLADKVATLTTALVNAGLAPIEASINALTNLRGTINDLIDGYQAARDAAQATYDLALNARDIAISQMNPTWQDRRCHRSALSGQAKAALSIERADHKTSVTLVHLSCSGATIDEGLLGPYDGIEAASPSLKAQVERALELIGTREVDAVLVSIGANDVGFGDIAAACIVQEPCNTLDPATRSAEELGVSALCAIALFFGSDCQDYYKGLILTAPAAALKIFNDRKGGLPSAYQRLSTSLRQGFPAIDRAPSRVMITEYMNATESSSGGLCGPEFGSSNLLGLSPIEWGWARDEVTTIGMNQQVLTAATMHGWTAVTGIFSDFAAHGYCAGDNWMVRNQESFLRQADHFGTLHPNSCPLTSGSTCAKGHDKIRDRLVTALESQFYPTNDVSSPRRPQVPPVADPGGPYALDEGSQLSVVGRSVDPSRTAMTLRWSLDVSPPGAAGLSGTATVSPTLSGLDDAIGALTVTAENAFGLSTKATGVTVRNVPPSFDAAPDLVLAEGDLYNLRLAFTDPGAADVHTAQASWGEGNPAEAMTVSGRLATASHRYLDEGSYHLALSVRDDDGGAGTDSVQVTVTNAPPLLGPITAPTTPLLVGSAVGATAHFSDAGIQDTHAATWFWDDGTTSPGTVTQTGGSGNVAGSHTFTAAGIYTLRLVVADNDGGTAEAFFRHVVVIDPGAGSVTAAGVVDSPAGRASLAFTARYQGRALIPMGSATFNLDPTLRLRGESYDWLVIKGQRAEFQGTAQVNGVSGYSFLVVVETRVASPDAVRIKVWQQTTGAVIYDNVPTSSDDIDDAILSPLVGGRVQLH